DDQRDRGNLPAEPGETRAEDDGGNAVEHFEPPLHLRRRHVEHEVGPDMTVGAHELARHDQDRPDHEIDDDLLGETDRLLRKEVARGDLPQREPERHEPKQASERLLGAIPKLHHGVHQPAAAMSAEIVATISAEMFDSFATSFWRSIIALRLAANSCADGTATVMPCDCTVSRARACAAAMSAR